MAPADLTWILMGGALVLIYMQIFRSRTGAMSPVRKWAILATFPFMIISANASRPRNLARVLTTLSESPAILVGPWLLITSFASAVLVTELVRVAAPRTSTWSDRTHFLVVAATTLALAIIQGTFLMLSARRVGAA